MIIVGTGISGGSGGSRSHDEGGMFARYQLSAAVSAPSRRRPSTRASRSSGGNVPGAAVSKTKRRRLAKSSSESHASATPGNWNSSMYQLLACWLGSSRRRRADTGPWGAFRIVSVRTIPGRLPASPQARLPPQSWPTTWALSCPNARMSPATSPTSARAA